MSYQCYIFSSCSPFSTHLGYKLSKVEVDNLLIQKWKYKWEVPAIGMSSCSWVGTGECFLKVYLPSFILLFKVSRVHGYFFLKIVFTLQVVTTYLCLSQCNAYRLSYIFLRISHALSVLESTFFCLFFQSLNYGNVDSDLVIRE